jgi:hypothetical protein
MFGFRWSDGSWRSEREPREQPTSPELKPPKPKRPPQGFFKGGWRAIRDAALTRNGRAHLYLVWLQTTFTKPTLARVVFEQGRRQGFPVSGLRRARIRLGVKTIRAGGKGTGRKNPWVWMFPTSVSQND